MHQELEYLSRLRLMALEAAVLAVLRDAKVDGRDGLSLEVKTDSDGDVTIDLTYWADGLPVAGESL
jgi:hypothetical protein